MKNGKTCVFLRLNGFLTTLEFFRSENREVSNQHKHQCYQVFFTLLTSGQKLVRNWSETRLLTGQKPRSETPTLKGIGVVSDRELFPTFRFLTT
jgi:hypothetical protein